MICKPCRKGADWLDQGSAFPEDVTFAKTLHDKCKGCDCQHRVDLQAEGRSVRR